MSRYIDADALMEKMKHRWERFGRESDCICLIEDAPTIDALPVSYIYKRAMELKNDDMMYAYTVLNSLIANYRADGERKEKDDE